MLKIKIIVCPLVPVRKHGTYAQRHGKHAQGHAQMGGAPTDLISIGG
tara:strand:+ start:1282 stop:1422 length:141 start_codon:yes stop_codon:yes gene_type:complete